MDAHQHFIFCFNIAFHQGNMLPIVNLVFVNDYLKIAAETGRNRRFRHSLDERFVLHPVINEIGDGDNF